MSHNGIICNGIYVGDNYQRDISLMKEMFVDDFVICKNFNYVDTYLMDKISKQIIRSIKANYNYILPITTRIQKYITQSINMLLLS